MADSGLGLRLTPELMRSLQAGGMIKSADPTSTKIYTDRVDQYTNLSPDVFGSLLAMDKNAVVLPCATTHGGSTAFDATKPAPLLFEPKEEDFIVKRASTNYFIDLHALKKKIKDPEAFDRVVNLLYTSAANDDYDSLNASLAKYGVQVSRKAGQPWDILAGIPRHLNNDKSKIGNRIELLEQSPMGLKSIMRTLDDVAEQPEKPIEKIVSKKVKSAAKDPGIQALLQRLDMLEKQAMSRPKKKKKKVVPEVKQPAAAAPKPAEAAKVPREDLAASLGFPFNISAKPAAPRCRVLFNMGEQIGVIQSSYHHVVTDCPMGLVLVYDTRWTDSPQFLPSPDKADPFFVNVRGAGNNLENVQVRVTRWNFQLGVLDITLLAYVLRDVINPNHVDLGESVSPFVPDEEPQLPAGVREADELDRSDGESLFDVDFFRSTDLDATDDNGE